MYNNNIILRLRIIHKTINSLKYVNFSTISYYDVRGPKHTSKHDYSGEIDNYSLNSEEVMKTDTVIKFLKSPEYQVLKTNTPAPIAILNSFYNYSPLKRYDGLKNVRINTWGNIELNGYHKITDFLWYLGINNIISKDEIERFSHNFSIADLSIDDAIKLILVFDGLKGPLNVCSLAMYEHLFHDKPVTTEQLLSLAYALGKVKHSIDTLTLPLVSILHKSSMDLNQRIKLFLAISRLEPNINLIEFYTFSYVNDEPNSLLQIINMNRWDTDIRKESYVDNYNLIDYSVNLSTLQIFQLINGLSNITLEWIIGSVHKRIELKRLWNSNLGNEIIYRDHVFSYRNPLLAFSKILLEYLNKLEFAVIGFYIIENNTNLPIHGISLAHVLNLIDQMKNLEENSHYTKIVSIANKLTPSAISDIVEFIKIIKFNSNIVNILESFVTNMEKKYNVTQYEFDGQHFTGSNYNLNNLNEIIRNMADSNTAIKDKLTKTFEKIKYISYKHHMD